MLRCLFSSLTSLSILNINIISSSAVLWIRKLSRVPHIHIVLQQDPQQAPAFSSVLIELLVTRLEPQDDASTWEAGIMKVCCHGASHLFGRMLYCTCCLSFHFHPFCATRHAHYRYGTTSIMRNTTLALACLPCFLTVPRFHFSVVHRDTV